MTVDSDSGPTLHEGRILSGIGGLYTLETTHGEHVKAGLRGRLRLGDKIPLAGDFVSFGPSGDPDRPWRVIRIHDRRNELIRPAVANLDLLLAVVSTTEPEPDRLLLDVLLAMAWSCGIEPVLVVTKTDLAPVPQDLIAEYSPTGMRIIRTAPDDAAGLIQLRDCVKGCVAVMAGQSGVGKSTLANRLAGQRLRQEGDISERTGRGRHTTRDVTLIPVNGGYLADTPGYANLQMDQLELDGAGVLRGYPELESGAQSCHFADCRHLDEPGCAAADAVIHPARLERYRVLRRQADSQPVRY